LFKTNTTGEYPPHRINRSSRRPLNLLLFFISICLYVTMYFYI